MDKKDIKNLKNGDVLISDISHQIYLCDGTVTEERGILFTSAYCMIANSSFMYFYNHKLALQLEDKRFANNIECIDFYNKLKAAGFEWDESAKTLLQTEPILTKDDLMYGDFVYSRRNGVNEVLQLRCNISSCVFYPIPLSREFINKNFDKTKYLNVFETYVLGHIPEVTHIGYNIEAREERFCITRENGTFIMDVKYVHELQHFLKLAKIDKELKV